VTSLRIVNSVSIFIKNVFVISVAAVIGFTDTFRL